MDLMRVSAPPADPNSDLDGDGFSAYEEMLLWQDPHRADQIPRPLSAIEVEIARKKRRQPTNSILKDSVSNIGR
jgi:hypothetical protein